MTAFNRRDVLAASATAAIGGIGAVAASQPASAQSASELSFVSAFDARRDAISAPQSAMAETLATITAGGLKLKVQPTAPAAPGATALYEAVRKGDIDVVHLQPGDLFAVDPVFALLDGVPFGLNARMHRAWLTEDGGLARINAALAGRGVVAIPAGAMGAQMGGWFRAEITTAETLKSATIACSGLTARVFEALGAQTRSLAPETITSALRAGEITGAVWGLPYDDENYRLYQAAQVLHYPGWWNGSGQMAMLVNLKRYEALSDAHRAALEAAAAVADRQITARYDVQNPAAVKRAVASGARLQPYTEELLDACFAASNATLADIAKASPQFKDILESMTGLRAETYLWFQLAENTFDTYLMIQQRKQAL